MEESPLGLRVKVSGFRGVGVRKFEGWEFYGLQGLRLWASRFGILGLHDLGFSGWGGVQVGVNPKP